MGEMKFQMQGEEILGQYSTATLGRTYPNRNNREEKL